jgi:serine/threonine protein kinase
MECPACHTPNIDGARFCAKCGSLLPAAQKDESDPLIGSIVGGRFNILGILGEGGMGRVYTAEQQMGTTVRKVAVKTLLSEYARDPKVVERFMRECATVVELDHPNTIKFYDYGKTDAGDLYIAMELLTGVSLEKALEAGALSPDRVDRILSQISGSLQEAHDKGIVHRDLKPANIYLTTRAGETDYVKVLDFGIAKRDDKHTKQQEAKLTQQGTVLGTPPYMSPEQFRGQELDARSDIYSLGVMAYEMLTGRLPFDADTPWAWATQHMTAQPFPFETVPLGSAVPPKMKSAVMRSLSKDKTHRPQTVRDFFEEFTMGGGGGRASATSARSSLPDGAGQTQVAPAYGSGPLPAYGSGPQQAYPSGSMPDHAPSNPPVIGAYPSSPGMAVPSGGYPSAPGFPAPPAPAPRRSSAGIIVGVMAAVGVVGIVGAVLMLKKGSRGGAEGADAGATLVVTTAAAPIDAGKAAVVEEDAGAPPAESGTPHVPPHAFDPHAEQECHAAEMAANRGMLAEARHHLLSCEGPGKQVARQAIEQAERRPPPPSLPPPPPPPPPPCRGRHCPR